MNYFICWAFGLMLGLIIGFGFWHQAQKKCDEALDTLEDTLKAYAEVLCSRHLPSATDSMIILQELDMIERLGLGFGDEEKGNA